MMMLRNQILVFFERIHSMPSVLSGDGMKQTAGVGLECNLGILSVNTCKY